MKKCIPPKLNLSQCGCDYPSNFPDHSAFSWGGASTAGFLEKSMGARNRVGL